MKSPITFYQMIGRGTRVDEASGKLMFRVYDYTDATRLFGQEFITSIAAAQADPTPTEDFLPQPTTPREQVVEVHGFEVHINDAGRYILTRIDGKAMPMTVEDYKQRLATGLIGQTATLDAFRERWILPAERAALLDSLPGGERSAMLVRQLETMDAYDLFDVLAELGYGIQPLTRAERADAFSYKQADWLAKLPDAAASTLKAIAAQFATTGIEGLESDQLFDIPAVRTLGGIRSLRGLPQTAAAYVLDIKRKILAA
jgi:type I restriction enzyme R subunit